MKIATTEEIISDASQGKIFILIDDEKRENEGDLCLLGDFANPDSINFMAKYGRGLICLAITKLQSERLGLSLMERKNESRYDTAFTTSIEARTGVTTGISASDRSITIKTAINEQNNESHITTPGHIFPIIARDGGTLVRAGHTEAVVDIAKLSGLNPSGVICEIMKDNGEMARLPDLIEFAKEHNIKIGTIADLISYRRKNEKIVKRSTERNFLSNYGGEWRIIVYKSLIDDIEHIALVKGFINDESSTLVRVHSFNAMTDLLGEKSFDKAENILSKSMKLISGKGKGVIILINDSFQEFLSKKIKISIQNSGDTKSELRNYGVGAQILSDLGLKKMILISNSKQSPLGLKGFGLEVEGWHSLD